MMQHLSTLVWLRWRLTRNQWQRQGTASRVIALLVAGLGALLAVAGGVAGVYCGWGLLPECPALVIMLVWDGLAALFLFFWLIGLVSEIQKAEMLDLRHLLHLPISLREAFLLNYLSSLCGARVLFFLPAMLGLAVGYALAVGPLQLLLVLLVLGLIFMVTAWSYCLQSWLGAIMANPRRRRTVIVVVTVVFILLSQLPNLLMQARGGKARSSAATGRAAVVDHSSLEAECAGLERAQLYIPLLWLPQGAKALAEGHAGVAACGIMGMLALGFLGLARAYRTTVRAYRGVEKAPVRTRTPAPVSGRTDGVLLVERTLPLLPDDVAAMALANLRSMLRAPEVKMALFGNTLMMVFLGAASVLGRHTELPAEAHPFIASAAVALSFMGMQQLMTNHFGFDRSGFRALVLLPTSRRNMLLGKNLAVVPFGFVAFLVCLVAATILTGLRPVHWLLATLTFFTAFFWFSAAGNLTSILIPFRITAGSMRPNKLKSSTALLVLLASLATMAVGTLIFVPPALGLLCDRFHVLSGGLVTVVAAAIQAILTALLYWVTLAPLGRLLQQREQQILTVVTQAVE